MIAGQGHDEDRVRREVQRLGLDERVRFVGWVRGEENALFPGGEIPVQPARYYAL